MEICFCQPSRHPSKRKTFVWHLYNVGPTSKTLGRCCINVMQIFCVSWVAFYYILDRTRAVYNNRVVPVGLLPIWYLFQLTSPRLICRTHARISTVEPDHRRIHLIFWSPYRPPISKPKVMCMLRVVSSGTSQEALHSRSAHLQTYRYSCFKWSQFTLLSHWLIYSYFF